MESCATIRILRKQQPSLLAMNFAGVESGLKFLFNNSQGKHKGNHNPSTGFICDKVSRVFA